MKIAYVLSRFPQLTETFILREMLNLRDLGLEIHVFALLPVLQMPVHQQVQEMMPYVHYSPFLLSIKLLLAHFYFLFHSPIKYLKALFKAIWQTWREPVISVRVLAIFPKSVYFAREMQKLDIDHIHAHFLWINGIAAQIISDLTGITFTLHPHAFGLFMRDQKNVRRQLEFADGVITISEYHRNYIADLSPHLSKDDILVVHDGLDPREFMPAHVDSEDGIARILSVGSLTEKKGHEYLIDACAQIAKNGIPFRCSIVGGGPLQSKLQERIDNLNLHEKVLLLGPRTQTEVKSYYQHSDIFVLACVVARSGDRDGMPNVLLEAMSMELPVVTTPVTGIPELVFNDENGLLVPGRDVSMLAQAMMCLIEGKSLRLKLGRCGRETVIEGFDIRQSAAQLAEIFQAIVDCSGRRGR